MWLLFNKSKAREVIALFTALLLFIVKTSSATTEDVYLAIEKCALKQNITADDYYKMTEMWMNGDKISEEIYQAFTCGLQECKMMYNKRFSRQSTINAQKYLYYYGIDKAEMIKLNTVCRVEAVKDSTGNGKKAFIFLYCLHKRLETIRKNQSPRKTECLQEEKLTEIELNDTLNHWKKSNTSDIKFNCFIDCYLQKEGLMKKLTFYQNYYSASNFVQYNIHVKEVDEAHAIKKYAKDCITETMKTVEGVRCTRGIYFLNCLRKHAGDKITFFNF